MQEHRPFHHGLDRLPWTFSKKYRPETTLHPPKNRCHAVGLEKGDCRDHQAPGSFYCYYHEKLQRGITEPSVATPEDRAAGDDRPGMALYPVWPLPEKGYVLQTQSPRRLAVA